VIAVLIILYLIHADAANFSESVALFTLITIVLFTIFSFKSGKDDLCASKLNLIFVLVAGAIATAIFWLRAWIHLPGGLYVELFFNLFVYAFWWPGVLYGSLIRHPKEGWIPSSKKRFFQYCGTGFIAGLIGFITAYYLFENHPELISAAETFMAFW